MTQCVLFDTSASERRGVEIMNLFECRSLHKTHRLGRLDVIALSDVNLQIGCGEFVTIEGPSGSGKSTLLNILGLLDQPTKGILCFQGKDITELTDDQITGVRGKAIGFIFQKFNLIPVLTAEENVMLPLEMQGMSSRQAGELARYRLEQVGLSTYRKHLPDRMSGGQQQRVAIARALAGDPSVIVADEPTANLDSETSKLVMDILVDLHKSQNITLLVSTHDDFVMGQASRRVRLVDGRVVQDRRVYSTQKQLQKPEVASERVSMV